MCENTTDEQTDSRYVLRLELDVALLGLSQTDLSTPAHDYFRHRRSYRYSQQRTSYNLWSLEVLIGMKVARR